MGSTYESCVVMMSTVYVSLEPGTIVASPPIPSDVPVALDEVVELKPVIETPVADVLSASDTVMPLGLGLVSNGPPFGNGKHGRGGSRVVR